MSKEKVSFPNQIRTDEVESGPDRGWLWNTEEIEVGLNSYPLYQIDIVGIMTLAAWRHFHIKNNHIIFINEQIKSPYSYQTGMLSVFAGRAVSLPSHHLFMHVADPQQTACGGAIAEAVESMQIPLSQGEDVLRHCLEDLSVNVFHHAQAKGMGAFVGAVFNPVNQSIQFVVVDCGRGIPEAIREKYGLELTEEQALRLAVTSEVSGSSAGQGVNRGVGLTVCRGLTDIGQGKMKIISHEGVLDFSNENLRATEGVYRKSKSYWKGTIVSGMFSGSAFKDFQSGSHVVSKIMDGIDGRGPHYQSIRFLESETKDPLWTLIPLSAEVRKAAISREHAYQIAHATVLPVLADNKKIILNFSNIRTTTQAFCHALLSEAAEQYGPSLLERLQLIACSSQVQIQVRGALEYGFRRFVTKDSAATGP